MLHIRLKEEREKLDWTQAKFAQKMQVSQSAQANYEKGIRFPDAQYLQKAAEFGCDILYILIGTSQKKNIVTKIDEVTMLAQYRNANKTLRSAAMRVLSP